MLAGRLVVWAVTSRDLARILTPGARRDVITLAYTVSFLRGRPAPGSARSFIW